MSDGGPSVASSAAQSQALTETGAKSVNLGNVWRRLPVCGIARPKEAAKSNVFKKKNSELPFNSIKKKKKVGDAADEERDPAPPYECIYTVDDVQALYSEEPTPSHKLLKHNSEGGGTITPCVILSCGAFSPPTVLHLRLMEDARDAVNAKGNMQVLGGFLSPVHDAYGKKGLLPAYHRVNMLGLACEDSDWLQVEPWEAAQEGWSRTLEVINHIRDTLPVTRPRTKVLYTCGADQFMTWNDIKPDGKRLWAAADVEGILTNGLVVFTRKGMDMNEFLDHPDQKNIKVFTFRFLVLRFKVRQFKVRTKYLCIFISNFKICFVQK